MSKPNHLRFLYPLLMLAYLAMLALLAIPSIEQWTVHRGASGQQFFSALFIWLLKALPLLILLPALLRQTRRGLIWFCFVCLLYFSYFILVAFSAEGQTLGLSLSLCCLLAFTCALLQARKLKSKPEQKT